jgi:hypothetical protein
MVYLARRWFFAEPWPVCFDRGSRTGPINLNQPVLPSFGLTGQGLKPGFLVARGGTTEVVPCYKTGSKRFMRPVLAWLGSVHNGGIDGPRAPDFYFVHDDVRVVVCNGSPYPKTGPNVNRTKCVEYPEHITDIVVNHADGDAFAREPDRYLSAQISPSEKRARIWSEAIFSH